MAAGIAAAQNFSEHIGGPMRAIRLYTEDESAEPVAIRCTGKPFLANGVVLHEGDTATIPRIDALDLVRRGRAQLLTETA
jgi:hypothetical protein